MTAAAHPLLTDEPQAGASAELREIPAESESPATGTKAAACSERLERPASVGKGLLWSYTIAFIVLHLLVPLAALDWMFSWGGLLLLPISIYVFGVLGINLAYHRMLAHQGLRLPKWLEYTLAVCGVCCLQDAPARWVAIHRMHHQHSDERPDPHSPLVTFFWGHMGWLMARNKYLGTAAFYDRYTRDLLKDPFYLFLERGQMWLLVYLAHTAAFFIAGFFAGWLIGGELLIGLQAVLWGVVIRTVYVWHVTWAVNSITHVWGYRNYSTSDNSRNNPLVALFTNGEGWHNNHHAQPRAAAHGHRWWELDVTWRSILLLKWLGLATNVVEPKRTGKLAAAAEEAAGSE